MADKVSIAIRQADALARVQAAVKELGKRAQLPEVDLQPSGRDPALVRAVQLEAVANVLEAVVNSIWYEPLVTTESGAPKKALAAPKQRGGR